MSSYPFIIAWLSLFYIGTVFRGEVIIVFREEIKFSGYSNGISEFHS
jgi:hypothetical protein